MAFEDPCLIGAPIYKLFNLMQCGGNPIMRINVNDNIRLGLDIICACLFSIKITKKTIFRSFRDILPSSMVAEYERLNRIMKSDTQIANYFEYNTI